MLMFLSKNFWIGAAMSAAIVGGYMVVVYGPSQFKAGGDAKALQSIKDTEEAARGITDAAEREKFMRLSCVAAGRVWNFGRGKCVDRAAD